MPKDSEPTRKVRPKPGPYQRQKKKKVDKDAPKTSAKPAGKQRKDNLTLGDWLAVFKFMDAHPHMPQTRVVDYWRENKKGALIFTQATLSRKLKQREELEARANSTPSALSGKRVRAVTRPDVERALLLWVRHMEEKGETYSGAMLQEKRKRFEISLGVPPEQRLEGLGWIGPFCRQYKIKEVRRHGEAGSVDLAAVAAERERVQKKLSRYALRDQFNVDETGFFWRAPPDRGLASKQMSGKKQQKDRITLAFVCNADGSEKFEPFFIGKAKNPRCFGKKGPCAAGYYYRNNATAWMTAVLFEEFIKRMDLRMRSENRHVILTMDNFAGHFIDYEPTSIELEYFEPNLTSFVQPLDAGIIRCFKAHYRKQLCGRAIDLDELGEREIFKIDLKEAMRMAQEAWDSVTADTISHCWIHAGIVQRNTTTTQEHSEFQPSLRQCVETASSGWAILEQFASDSAMSLPAAEKALEDLLGGSYKREDWGEGLDAVMKAEGDVDAALSAISALRGLVKPQVPIHPAVVIAPQARPDQLSALEKDLMDSVNKLRERNRIFGEALTIDEIVDPQSERGVLLEDPPFAFPGGDDEIVERVRYEKRVACGEVIEIDDDEDDDDEDEDPYPDTGVHEMIDLVVKLQKLTTKFGGKGSNALQLNTQLRRYQAMLRKEESLNAKQTDIGDYFARIGS